MKMEDYLKYTGQTEKQLRDMYRSEAENRAKVELVLEAIRKAEAIEPTEEEVDEQIAEQAKRAGQEKDAYVQKLTERQKEYLRDNAAIMKVINLMKSTATFVKEEGHEGHDGHEGHEHHHH